MTTWYICILQYICISLYLVHFPISIAPDSAKTWMCWTRRCHWCFASTSPASWRSPPPSSSSPTPRQYFLLPSQSSWQFTILFRGKSSFSYISNRFLNKNLICECRYVIKTPLGRFHLLSFSHLVIISFSEFTYRRLGSWNVWNRWLGLRSTLTSGKRSTAQQPSEPIIYRYRHESLLSNGFFVIV